MLKLTMKQQQEIKQNNRSICETIVKKYAWESPEDDAVANLDALEALVKYYCGLDNLAASSTLIKRWRHDERKEMAKMRLEEMGGMEE